MDHFVSLGERMHNPGLDGARNPGRGARRVGKPGDVDGFIVISFDFLVK